MENVIRGIVIRDIAGNPSWVDALGMGRCVWVVDGPNREAALAVLVQQGYQPTESPIYRIPDSPQEEHEHDRLRLFLDAAWLINRERRDYDSWSECACINDYHSARLRDRLAPSLRRWRAFGRAVGYVACGVETQWPWGGKASQEHLESVVQNAAKAVQPDVLVSLARDNRCLRWPRDADEVVGRACMEEIDRRFQAGEFRFRTYIERPGSGVLKVDVDQQYARVTVTEADAFTSD